MFNLTVSHVEKFILAMLLMTPTVSSIAGFFHFIIEFFLAYIYQFYWDSYEEKALVRRVKRVFLHSNLDDNRCFIQI